MTQFRKQAAENIWANAWYDAIACGASDAECDRIALAAVDVARKAGALLGDNDEPPPFGPDYWGSTTKETET